MEYRNENIRFPCDTTGYAHDIKPSLDHFTYQSTTMEPGNQSIPGLSWVAPRRVASAGHSRSSSDTSSLNLGAPDRLGHRNADLGHVADVRGGGIGGHVEVGRANETWRSMSLISVSSEGSTESHLVEQEDIVVLTHDVRAFKDALGKLRRIFYPEKEKQETLRVCSHERLGEVLRILRNILEKYPPIQSTELLMAAGTLIQQVKAHKYEDDKSDPADFFDAIDQLALAFSSRVSEYLMGDLDASTQAVPKTKSCENILPSEDAQNNFAKEKLSSVILTAQEIDLRLMQLADGVDLALRRAKAWSKYAKDVMNYIEKRASAEAEHARNLAKLAQSTRPTLKEESYLPFQSIYCTALDQDLENSNHCLTTYSLLMGQKYIEPLSNRKMEHEKTRKHLKDIWQRELKKMNDAVNNLRKAKAMYIQRHQEHEKAKESSFKAINSGEGCETSKLDKKRKLEDDAFQKAIEAETTYKSCVIEANERHQALEQVKSDVLKKIRELIYQCDQTMKAVTVAYFHLQHTVSAPAPVQFQTLCESSRLYEPGAQYMEFVKRLPVPLNSLNNIEGASYVFESYNGENRLEKDRSSGSNESGEEHLFIGSRLSDGKVPLRAWSQNTQATLGSDSDSVSSYHSNKSQDTSPTASPRPHRPIVAGLSSGDELETEHEINRDSGLGSSRRHCMSKAAQTHTFRRLKTPSRCRECDAFITLISFQGVECTECGLTTHRKCLEYLAIQCGRKRLDRKLNTFGVSLSSHSLEMKESIPEIVLKCIKEIEEKGLYLKGIYRVSGVKSRVEKLCQSFENGADLVDLTDVHASVVANVLKFYLRQLPEPLLTFKLYQDFVNIAKDHPAQLEEGFSDRAIHDLQMLVRRLPPAHFATLACLMQHLKRLSEYSEHNHMPPSNLGIVFGPTLLRTSEGSASLSSLVDTVHQTRVIEMLISYAYEVFGKPNDDGNLSKADCTSSKGDTNGPKRKTSGLSESEFGDNKEPLSSSLPSELMRDYPIPGFFISDNSERGQVSEDYTHSSNYWLETSLVSDEDIPEIYLPDDAEPKRPSKSLPSPTNLSQTVSPSLLKSKDDMGPVPPPRRALQGTNSLPIMPNSTSKTPSPIPEAKQEETNIYTSSAQVTLSSKEKTKPTSKATAELRRQFFESPPLVFKSDSLSQFVSSPTSPTADFEIVPSSDSGSSLATGSSEGSSEADRPINFRMSLPPHKPISRLSPSESSSSDHSSPLTTSISHLGLTSLLRPFSGNSTGNQTNGKWHNSSFIQQRERRSSVTRNSEGDLSHLRLEPKMADSSPSVSEQDKNCFTSSPSTKSDCQLPQSQIWQQTVSSRHHVSTVKVNQVESSSSVRETYSIQLKCSKPLEGEEKTENTLDSRNPEFV